MIRKAVYETDSESIYTLINKSYRERDNNKDTGILSVDRWRLDVSHEAIRKEIDNMNVYEQDGKIIGCLRAVVQADKVYLGPFAVDSHYQGTGVGQKLLSNAESLAPISVVELICWNTGLIKFYNKRGYKEVGKKSIFVYYKTNQVLKPGTELIVCEKAM